MLNIITTTELIVISLLITYIVLLQRKLKKSEAKDVYLEYLLKYIPVGFYFRDLKGNITLVNNELANMSNCTNKDLLNKNISKFFSAEDLKNSKSEDEQVLKSKKTLTFEREFLIRGRKISYKIMKSPIINIEGEIIGLIVVFKNIEKEKEIEASKESFIATLTHDLKTPTFAQINTLKMLLNEEFGKLNDTQKEIIKLSKDSCIYVSDLISTILDTYCYDHGKIKLNKSTFDIVELIYDLGKSLKYALKENYQQIIFTHNNPTCLIYADKLQIKRVITNMLSNAINYGNKSSIININLNDEKDNLEFSVINESEPIPEKELDTMFNRFKETKLSYFNKTSTGLGLYLSKQIIDIHHGKIFVKSCKEGLCTFGFKLPKNTDKCETFEISKSTIQ